MMPTDLGFLIEILSWKCCSLLEALYLVVKQVDRPSEKHPFPENRSSSGFFVHAAIEEGLES